MNLQATFRQNNVNEIKVGEQTINSLEIAEMVGREHKEVLRDIRNIIEHIGDERKIALNYFSESTYKDNLNRQKPMYLLTKKGCELYGTRMTGVKGTQFAVSYIERFNIMEQELLNSNRPSYEIGNPIERAAKWIEEQKEKLALEEKIQEQKPKVLLAEAVMASEGSIEVGTLSKILSKNGIKIGRNKLFEWLRKNDYLIKEGKAKNEPTQRFVNQGWFEVIITPFFKPDGSTDTKSKTMVTSKGQKKILDLFLKFNLK